MYLFQRGETVVIDITIMDAETEEPVNVNGVGVTLRDPNASVIDTGAMTNTSTGMYSYSYNLSSEALIGEYQARLNISTLIGYIVHDVYFYVEP